MAIYNSDMRHGYSYLGAAKFDMNDRTGRFMDGVILFIDYVLATWPFRKLYMETPEYNYPQIRSGVGRLLVQEGTLAQHIWLADRYWDLHVLALYRTAWDARRHKLVDLVTRSRVMSQ